MLLLGSKSRHNLGSDLAAMTLTGALCDSDNPAPRCRSLSAVGAVGVLSVNPEADLGVLKGGDAHRHVVVLLHSVDIHPLVA